MHEKVREDAGRWWCKGEVSYGGLSPPALFTATGPVIKMATWQLFMLIASAPGHCLKTNQEGSQCTFKGHRDLVATERRAEMLCRKKLKLRRTVASSGNRRDAQ